MTLRCPCQGRAVGCWGMANANGAAAVARGGADQLRGESDEDFFSDQLDDARSRARRAALSLLAVCAEPASATELDEAAEQMIHAAAELRIAAFASQTK